MATGFFGVPKLSKKGRQKQVDTEIRRLKKKEKSLKLKRQRAKAKATRGHKRIARKIWRKLL
jgi:hypothetical protein